MEKAAFRRRMAKQVPTDEWLVVSAGRKALARRRSGDDDDAPRRHRSKGWSPEVLDAIDRVAEPKFLRDLREKEASEGEASH